MRKTGKPKKISRTEVARWTLLLGVVCLLAGGAQGGPPFSDVTDQAGLTDAENERGLAWGDFDGDGDLDLYVARAGANSLYRNEGDGTFVDVAADAGVTCPTVTWGLAWGDYDLNGTIDLYLCNFDNQTNLLYSNNGDGTFTDVSSASGVTDSGHGTSATWADFDNDHDLDFYLANKDGANRLFRNDGQGRFTDVADSAGAQDTNDSIGSIWGDCDNDGDLDLLISANLKKNRLFLNKGDGTFDSAGPGAGLAHEGGGRGLGFADFDLDGDLDLYLANSDGPNILYRNTGKGVFEDVTEGSGTEDKETGTAIAWADYDSDGDLDLFLSNFGQKMRLFENNTGGGYQSQSPHEVHFGLGQYAEVDSMTVRWPSGEVTRHGPYQANQVLNLTDAR